MRIVLVGTGWLPLDTGAGGIEHLVRTWAEVLGAAHQVELWSVSPASDVVDGPSPAMTRWADDPVDLVRRLADERYDIAHFHNRPTWAARVPRSVVTLHNDLEACLEGPAGPVASLAEVTRALARVPTSTVSRYLAAVVAARADLPARPMVTPPSLDAAFLTPPVRTSADRTGPRQVLVPSRLLAKKGIGLALEVARSDRLGDVEFTFTRFLSPYPRPTPEQMGLIADIESTPRAHLVEPPADRAGMARLLAEADAVLVPSVWAEPFGLVSIEAQAVGTPVVVTDRGGLPETLASDAWPVSPTVEGLVEGLESALKGGPPDPARSARIREIFGHRHVLEQLERFYAGRRDT